jgi:hypothetical protein
MHMLEKFNSLLGIQNDLGGVLIDSMKVCKAMGIRYLWIDSLCIVQDDEASKHSQIQSMDMIYAKAYITLVAASEPGPHNGKHGRGEKCHQQNMSSGLARVSIPTTSRAKTFVIDEIFYTYSTWQIVETLEYDFQRSLGFSRGW